MNMEIPKAPELEQKVFSLFNEEAFTSIALELYQFQYLHNQVYQSYCNLTGRTPDKIAQWEKIPFLPISFFKTHKVVATGFEPDVIFTSSGTTGVQASRHYVKDLNLYKESFYRCFEQFYGPAQDYCILGLLPSYLERSHSSLVFMVEELIRKSLHPLSGFYLYDFEKLAHTLQQLENAGQKTLLFGVTFGLLDFSANYPQQLRWTTVLETGGMKGRKKEMTRMELYELLKRELGIAQVYSEYGMTELLSQAYGVDGIYRTPSWMRILLRDETDPFSILTLKDHLITGAINVIDLANIYSCSFIATDDLGRLHPNGSFEVLGRMDHSDVRGCSQMVM
jgi:phenylacetate-coenzyme A ligase PaaK-like adenylate-forming protein